MKLFVKGRGLKPTRSLRSYIERRVLFAMGRFADEIGNITVWIGDLNGPRGGVDKECKLQVALVAKGGLILCERDSDLYQAIDRVFDRAGHNISRQLDRRRQRIRPEVGTHWWEN